jgi:hypothetical protein
MSKPNEKRAYNSPLLRPVVLHASCTLFKEMLIEQAQEENQRASFAVGSCANRLLNF